MMAVRSGNVLHSRFLELRDEHFRRTNSGVPFSASRLTSLCELFGDWHLLLDRLLCHPPSSFVGSHGTVPQRRTFLIPGIRLVAGPPSIKGQCAHSAQSGGFICTGRIVGKQKARRSLPGCPSSGSEFSHGGMVFREDVPIDYGLALSVTAAPIASTNAYEANRKAPYFPAEVACRLGMKVDRLESATTSPTIPGRTNRSAANAQFVGAICRHRRIPMQRTPEIVEDKAKAPQ